MTSNNNTAGAVPSWLELERVCTFPEAERITSLSEDTLRRRYREHVVPLSPRRTGMKFKILLAITDGTLRPSSP
jgi:hypothetical protein